MLIKWLCEIYDEIYEVQLDKGLDDYLPGNFLLPWLNILQLTTEQDSGLSTSLRHPFCHCQHIIVFKVKSLSDLTNGENVRREEMQKSTRSKYWDILIFRILENEDNLSSSLSSSHLCISMNIYIYICSHIYVLSLFSISTCKATSISTSASRHTHIFSTMYVKILNIRLFVFSI